MSKKQVSWFSIRKNQYILLTAVVILLIIGLVSAGTIDIPNSNDFETDVNEASGETGSSPEAQPQDEDNTGVEVHGSGSGGSSAGEGTESGDDETPDEDGEAAGDGGAEDLGPTLGSACEDNPPYTILFRDNEEHAFCYNTNEYTLQVDFDETPDDTVAEYTMILKQGDTIIDAVDYTYGEGGDGMADGELIHGLVNLYDITLDDEVNLFVKALPYHRDTGAENYIGTLANVEGFNVIIDTDRLEICSNGNDEDEDGLADCADPECNMALQIEEDFTWCEYGVETLCSDSFDNDGDGATDITDSDCDPCETGVTTWSFMPEDTDFDIAPARAGCCEVDQCINIDDSCVDTDTEYTTGGGNKYYICGESSNWDKCGPEGSSDDINKYPDELSDGGGFICNKTESTYMWSPV
jgi:hypothetical protein